MRQTTRILATIAAAILQLIGAGRSPTRKEPPVPLSAVRLVVLPPPFSTSLFPELDRAQRRQLRKALLERYHCCAYCGRQFTGKSRKGSAKPTIDHVVPIAQGGANTLDNLVLSCGVCNNLKGNRTPEDMAQVWEAASRRLRAATWNA